ncbi:SusC/RagA family TonB-linked outer membrane protein [Alkaliflexus imshenetskii]|uniref:SusC/RagA family TonB-linked outer membrane protein n=1 Tax=Alkaliflexus imshenetskii TaxID=286730 RepID=UPI00047D357A|nr:TonB-dependent receptor [Alkaliflexus imshenetskii]
MNKKSVDSKMKSALNFKSFFTLLLLLMGTNTLMAQSVTVRGTVTEAGSREPIPGVNVIIEGTTQGTITDIDGNYQLNADGNATLVYSFIGYQLHKETVSGRARIDVALSPETTILDEVVAIGYGTTTRRDLTGAVSSVSESVLRNAPVASAAEAITGRMAGVSVTTTEGSPDAEIKIRIRGGGSISQDNSPLFIVDGFPVNSISDIPPGDIQSIDVLKDASSTAIYGARGANGVVIVSTRSGQPGRVTVNVNSYMGVRKVTDLLGVLNPYEYVMYQYELGQTEAFAKYYGVYDDLEIYKSIRGTNWQDEVFGRTATVQNYNASISGGGDNTRYNLSLSRADEESIMIGSGFERNNINLKLNSKLNDRVNIDFNTRMNHTVIDGAGVSSGSGSTTRLRNSVKYAPTQGLRGFDSTLEDDLGMISPETESLLFDPVQSTLDDYRRQKRFANNFGAALNWEIVKDLSFRSEWGYEFRQDRTDQVWGPSTSQSKNRGGQPVAQIFTRDGYSWRNANTLSLNKRNWLPGHTVNLLIGQEVTSAENTTLTAYAEYFPSDMTPADVLAMFNLGTPQPIQSRISEQNNMASFFGRANYSLYDKYMLNLTFRADGSSKFAQGNQWGYFPSAAFAWRLSEENFLENQAYWLSNLKLRVSYGTAGNNRISDGLWKMSYRTTGGKIYYSNETPDSYLVPGSSLHNPDLKWETTYTRNAGLDFGFFNNRLSGMVDVYWNTTKDLLVEAPLATASGYNTQFQNVGQTSNKGVELSLDGHLIQRRDFSLSASFNIGFNRNNVDKFRNGDENFKLYSSGWNGTAQPQEDYIIQEGRPVGQMYGYVTDGMYSFDDFDFVWVHDANGNPTNQSGWVLKDGVPGNASLTSAGRHFGPGALKFKDVSGPDGEPDGVIDAHDRQIIGNANPLHTGGFNITGRYKSFDFSVFMNWSYGNDVYNANKIDFSSFLLTRRYQNIQDFMSMDQRFLTIDPANGHNIYYGANANPQRLQELNGNASIWHPIMTTTPLHSWAIEDGSFLRINTVTLGYTLPKTISSMVNIETLRFYVSGYNLHTFTNYTGFDPEVDTRRAIPMTPGVDYSAYPKSFSILGGVNITF